MLLCEADLWLSILCKASTLCLSCPFTILFYTALQISTSAYIQCKSTRNASTRVYSKAFNKSWLLDNDLLEVPLEGNLLDLVNRRADKGEMISVTSGDTLLTAYNRMRASDISQIPVLEMDRLVGVLDEEDLLFNVSKSKDAFDKSVAQFMVTDLDILPSGASEDELMKTLASRANH